VISGGDIGDLPAASRSDPNTTQNRRTVTTVYDENGRPLDAEGRAQSHRNRAWKRQDR